MAGERARGRGCRFEVDVLISPPRAGERRSFFCHAPYDLFGQRRSFQPVAASGAQRVSVVVVLLQHHLHRHRGHPVYSQLSEAVKLWSTRSTLADAGPFTRLFAPLNSK